MFVCVFVDVTPMCTTTSGGKEELKREWVSGLFDKDSWTEYLADWAKTVVIGRARLGGIPVGIIAAETQTQKCITPPDPALEDKSSEVCCTQAGQVWFPDSSFKTAQAIHDFQQEQLPIFILANWRGFSGGQRDMFHQILKYGSYIVDELAKYKQPIFVYLPPHAQLRGGAWVVLDSLINEQYIEMYAAEKSKANVLEPTGSVGLKFRKKKLLKTMHRLDPYLIQLMGKEQHLKDILSSSPMIVNEEKADEEKADTKSELNKLHDKITNRERALLPIYVKIAHIFAELHDTPQRMKEVKVIRDIIFWKNSRRFFYWRLRRKLIVNQCLQKMISIDSDRDWKCIHVQFNEWVVNCCCREYSANEDERKLDVVHDECDVNVGKADVSLYLKSDQQFVEWFDVHQKDFVQFEEELKQVKMEKQIQSILNNYQGNTDWMLKLKDMMSCSLSTNAAFESNDGAGQATVDVD